MDAFFVKISYQSSSISHIREGLCTQKHHTGESLDPIAVGLDDIADLLAGRAIKKQRSVLPLALLPYGATSLKLVNKF